MKNMQLEKTTKTDDLQKQTIGSPQKKDERISSKSTHKTRIDLKHSEVIKTRKKPTMERSVLIDT